MAQETKSTSQSRHIRGTEYVLARELEHLATKEDMGNVRAEIANLETKLKDYIRDNVLKDINIRFDNIDNKLATKDTNKIILSVSGIIIAIATVLNLFGIHLK